MTRDSSGLSPLAGWLEESLISLWAQAPESSSRIVRILKFEGASPRDVFWFCVALFSGLMGLALLCIFYTRLHESTPLGSERNEEEKDPEARLGLTDAEKEVLHEIVVLAESELETCLSEVTDFDRGVDRLLIHAMMGDPQQKLEKLRLIRALRHKLGFDAAEPGEPLRSTHCLSTDQEVLLSVLDEDGQPTTSHVGTVFFNDEEGLLLRLLPREDQGNREPFTAEPPARIRVHFFRYQEGSYEFDSPLVEFRSRGPGFVRLKHAKSLRRLQRRNYPRVQLDETVYFRWLPYSNGKPGRQQLFREPDQEESEKSGRILDLSGGGIRLEVEKIPVTVDDWLEVRFPFLAGTLSGLKTYCRVVKIYESSADRIVCGARFESPRARLEMALLREVDRRLEHEAQAEPQAG